MEVSGGEDLIFEVLQLTYTITSEALVLVVEGYWTLDQSYCQLKQTMFLLGPDGAIITDTELIVYNADDLTFTIFSETLNDYHEEAINVVLIAHVIGTTADPTSANALNSVSFDLHTIDPCLSNTVSIEPISENIIYDNSIWSITVHLRLQESVTIDTLTDYEVISSFANNEICGDWNADFELSNGQ